MLETNNTRKPTLIYFSFLFLVFIYGVCETLFTLSSFTTAHAAYEWVFFVFLGGPPDCRVA